MIRVKRRYTCLDEAIDDMRALLCTSDESPLPDVSLSDEILEYVRIVIHEWVVNLIQHAEFRGATPTVEMEFQFENRHVSCVVKDNSEGFDLEHQLSVQQQTPPPFPERGMGLRIIHACTREMSYRSGADGWQHFSCIIPARSQPWVDTLF